MTPLSSPPAVVLLMGWSLLHFLWQGALISAVYAAMRRLPSFEGSPSGRYALALSALGAMAAAPVLTFAVLLLWSPGPPLQPWSPVGLLRPELLSALVSSWAAGVTALSLRTLVGWRYSRRLRSSAHPAPEPLLSLFRQQAARLGETRPVRLLVSALVEVPTVAGWLHPAVLIPLSSLSAMQLDHIVALLAHELAHIRRNDHLAALFQSLVESLFFYHPAVWWVSGHLRLERELCCDDLAVQGGADPLTYAKALAVLEALRAPCAAGHLAANGATLITRIRRLIAGHGLSPTPQPRFAAPGAVLLLWLLGAGAAAASTEPASEAAALPTTTVLTQIDYDHFLPSPAVLFRRFGTPHIALSNGPDLLRPVPASLSHKYGALHNVLRGHPQRLRHDATSAPVPVFPPQLANSHSRGLVIIEVVVSPAGRVQESLVLASFHPDASRAVTEALRQWHFFPIPQLAAQYADWRPCPDCLRIGRLAFEFRASPDPPRIVDLAALRHGPFGVPLPRSLKFY